MKAFLRTEYTNKQTTNIEEPRCLPQNALCQSTWQHHRALHTMHTRHIQAGYAHGERQPRPRMVDDLFQFLLHTLLLMLHCALSLSLHVSLSLSLDSRCDEVHQCTRYLVSGQTVRHQSIIAKQYSHTTREPPVCLSP